MWARQVNKLRLTLGAMIGLEESSERTMMSCWNDERGGGREGLVGSFVGGREASGSAQPVSH